MISPDNFNPALDLVMEKMGGFLFFFLFFCLSEFNADVKCEKIFRHVYHILSFYFLIPFLFDCVDSIIESVPPTRKSSSPRKKEKKKVYYKFPGRQNSISVISSREPYKAVGIVFIFFGIIISFIFSLSLSLYCAQMVLNGF